MRESLFNYVDSISDQLINMSDTIFKNPELGLQEHNACKLLCDFLEDNGFQVERGIAGLDTAFRAIYKNGEGGPSIGLLCEYDALEGLGHACAHHMQGPAMVGVAAALKAIVSEAPFQLVVYGTPAEETVSGKITMLEKGFFNDIDVALMIHGAPTTTADVKSLAMSRYRVRFHGKSAHAAIKPEDGRSALDSALLMFNAIEFLREHVKDGTRMHYTILNAGGPANAVQKYSESMVYLRSYSRNYLNTVTDRFKKIVEGAGLMTETTPEIIEDKMLSNKIPVLKLNELIMGVAKDLDAPTIRPPREQTGSSDFGNITNILPGTCLRIAFVPEGTSSHSQEYLDAGLSENLHNALILSAKIIAESCNQLIQNPEMVKEIQEEFENQKAHIDVI